ncbi:hypothetical protein K439DRAFT_1656781 [Ramaria rubella]|nr:hypothetical protein K439DRAFT_1656781 [Ramaria rubella]
MQIYRAEDGEQFQVNKTLQDIERIVSLEGFLHEITGVDEAAVLAYLSDGRRLKGENLRELAGATDQSIFVFNKHYLDYELDDVLLKLRVDPLLQPEFDHVHSDNLETLANAAISHYDSIVHLFNTIHIQHEALRIASTSLDLNVLSISDAFEGFASGGRRELEKQAYLLQGLDLDLEVISKIQIHPDFLSASARKAVEAGEKARTLGDYVSNVKMRQVGDACSKTHNELRGRFNNAEDAMTRLTSGAHDVRSSIVNSGLVEEAELCTKRSQEALERITDMRAHLQEPRTDESDLFAEIAKHDVVLRDEMQLITDIKNKSTTLCMRSLRHISHLNNDLMLLPQMLSGLQSDFRAKTNFAHIQRLHNMLYAYGATLVEIVRRKEFSRFFSHRAQTIAEIMAKLSSSERKHRQIYRGEVHGQLPFDAKGMDDAVPTMEITSAGASTSNYSIEREDLIALLDEVDKINQAHCTKSQNGDANHNPLRESRLALEKLINRMDNLETTFDKMAEKTIFSASRMALPRRQVTNHTDNEFQEIVEQLHELQEAKGDQDRQFMEDRHLLQTEIDHLHLELRNAREQSSEEKQRIVHMQDKLRHEQTQGEEEALARRVLEEREKDLLAVIEDKHKALTDVTTNLAEQINLSDGLRQELARAKADIQEAKRLEMGASGQVMQLLSERELMSRSLEEARTQEKELETQLSTFRQEVKDLHNDLQEAHDEKERRLKAQALEADRKLRDVIAEADGDRAVLEHQAERQLKESKAELEVSNAVIAELREELQRTEHELMEVRSVEKALRNDLRLATDAASAHKTRLDDLDRLSKDLLNVTTAFRDSHCKAFAAIQTSSSSSKSIANLSDSTTLLKPYVEPLPIDPEDLAGGLRILSGYDFTAYNDAVTKMGSTIRKWQKQCKEYRDRAKGKISFRNFTKGDLALFLPTRNSISKPWAAFNVSFPHYFLHTTGNLAEQLKTREWIVARITSITEQVAMVRDLNSNPYGLADGTKFYMLQVEDWTQSSPRRKSSPSKSNAEDSSHPGAPALTVDTSLSTPGAHPSMEASLPVSRQLFGPRPRTHSTPNPHVSSLSRLLAQGTPPIEEGIERTSPSPPRLLHSRPSSPLARPASPLARPASPLMRPSSPLMRPSSPLMRPSSPLARPSTPVVQATSPLADPSHKRHPSPSSFASPPQSRPSSPLANPPPVHGRSSSPLAGPSRSQPSPPRTSPTRARPPPPFPSSSYVRPASPLAGPSHPQPPSPHFGSLPGPSPVQASPKSTSPLHAGSRRSSSSSRPSTSSILSPGRHPFALSASSSATKAAATTALSDPSVFTPISGTAFSGSQEDLPSGGPGTPSPEGSPSEGLSSVLHARRRTISASTQSYKRTSPLSAPPTNHTLSDWPSQSGSQGALASLATSWGFGRKTRGSVRHSVDVETVYGSERSRDGGSSTSTTRTQRPAANEILKRYDDILPQDRGSRKDTI